MSELSLLKLRYKAADTRINTLNKKTRKEWSRKTENRFMIYTETSLTYLRDNSTKQVQQEEREPQT